MIKVHVAKTLPKDLEVSHAAEAAKRSAQATLEHSHSTSDVELSVILTDDAQLHALNQQFLEVDAPTDVLAFPGDEVDFDSGKRYLGDVLLSLPRAFSQARAGGHNYLDEVQLLTVHGVLHLLGHDHSTPEEKVKMWAAQAAILTQLGCSITGPQSEYE